MLRPQLLLRQLGELLIISVGILWMMTWHRTVTVIGRLSLLLLLQLAEKFLLLLLREELLLLLLRLETVGLDDGTSRLLNVHLVRRPLLRLLGLLLCLRTHAGDGATLAQLAALHQLAHVFATYQKTDPLHEPETKSTNWYRPSSFSAVIFLNTEVGVKASGVGDDTLLVGCWALLLLLLLLLLLGLWPRCCISCFLR
jgi:hypothetical protein